MVARAPRKGLASGSVRISAPFERRLTRSLLRFPPRGVPPGSPGDGLDQDVLGHEFLQTRILVTEGGLGAGGEGHRPSLHHGDGLILLLIVGGGTDAVASADLGEVSPRRHPFEHDLQLLLGTLCLVRGHRRSGMRCSISGVRSTAGLSPLGSRPSAVRPSTPPSLSRFPSWTTNHARGQILLGARHMTIKESETVATPPQTPPYP